MEKDSRALSTLLHARLCHRGPCGKGRENKGFLCENSLRLLAAPRVPRYVDNSIPGQGRTDNLTGDGETKDLDYRYGKRRQFKGVDVDEESEATLDELDETFSRIYVDEKGRLKDEFRATTPEDIWRIKYGHDNNEDNGPTVALAEAEIKYLEPAQDQQAQAEKEAESELYFDDNDMRWKSRPIGTSDNLEDEGSFKTKTVVQSLGF